MIDVNPEAAVRFSCPGCSSSACKKSWMMSLCGMSQCNHNDAIRLHVPNIQCAKNWRWMEEAADTNVLQHCAASYFVLHFRCFY